MSWARFGFGSDVYVFKDLRGGITCCSCRLQRRVKSKIPEIELHDDFNCATVEEMIEHLEQHQIAGHEVTEAMESAQAAGRTK